MIYIIFLSPIFLMMFYFGYKFINITTYNKLLNLIKCIRRCNSKINKIQFINEKNQIVTMEVCTFLLYKLLISLFKTHINIKKKLIKFEIITNDKTCHVILYENIYDIITKNMLAKVGSGDNKFPTFIKNNTRNITHKLVKYNDPSSYYNNTLVNIAIFEKINIDDHTNIEIIFKIDNTTKIVKNNYENIKNTHINDFYKNIN